MVARVQSIPGMRNDVTKSARALMNLLSLSTSAKAHYPKWFYAALKGRSSTGVRKTLNAAINGRSSTKNLFADINWPLFHRERRQ